MPLAAAPSTTGNKARDERDALKRAQADLVIAVNALRSQRAEGLRLLSLMLRAWDDLHDPDIPPGMEAAHWEGTKHVREMIPVLTRELMADFAVNTPGSKL